MHYVFAGLDPGQKGAWAVLDCRERTLATGRFPLRDVGVTMTKNILDAHKLVAVLTPHEIELVTIEDVYSRPKMGVVGAFSFGENKGTLRGICAALGYVTETVSPSVWKKRLKCPKDTDVKKPLIVAYTQQFFPRCKNLLVCDGQCEAALIALYGAILHGASITTDFAPSRKGKP